MITAIKDSNVEAYKLLFEEASDILSGYERVQTFDADKKYYYKNSLTKEFIEVTFDSIEDFANGLVEYVVLYTPVLNADGTPKGAVENFSSQIGITTLEEYYNWLPDLKRDVDGNPTKYTILPLDEPHFEINANTRAINIPNEFKKNGIAVQGDDLAEVVYFKVDRYFDAMDLNNTEIYIEWETPKDKTHEAIKSVSDIYIRDIESEPGKLIFGWAISDVLTAAAGNLKFSVKFLQWAENSETGKRAMVYALNTLTATVAIHQSIGLDVNTDYENIDNANDRLLERIEPGVVVGGIQAETPYFLENLDPNYEYDIVPNHTDGTLKIYAVATAADTGSVTYVWKRKDLDVNNNVSISELEIPNSSTTEMVPVALGSDGYPIFVERHAYYFGDNYVPFDGTIEDVKSKYTDPAQAPTFYEKKAVLEVDKYGVYTVEARNRIFNSMSKKKSDSATFKRPESVGIDNKNESAAGHIIGEANATLEPPYNMKAVGDISYQWYKAPEKATANDEYKFIDLPANSDVNYGENHVRILIPATTEFKHQNPNESLGGNKNTYYMTMVCYIPDGAVSLREGDHGVLDDELLMIADRSTGYDDHGFYRKRWLGLATYDEASQTWSYFGKNSNKTKYIGWDYCVEYYDENENLIKADKLRIDLSNEDCHVNLTAFEKFEQVVDGIDLAKQKAYTATEPGLYQVEITRTRNRGSISEKSLNYRVTYAPQTPEFVDGTWDAATFISVKDLLDGSKTLGIILKDNIDSDEYYVTWNLYRGDRTVPIEDLPIITQKITGNSSKFNPTDDMYREAFGDENIEGLYYAVVTNKLNGVMSAPTEVPASTEMFVVTGQ